MTDLDRAERELRAALAARAEDMPPKDLHAGVLRRARRHRIAVVAASATAVALVAAGVPTALAAARDEADTIPAVLPVPELFDCPASSASGQKPGQPWNDPLLPAQQDVAGSLGGTPAAVKAVAQAGWGAMSAYKPEVDVRRTKVLLAHRAEDGWIVGVVTGRTWNLGLHMVVPVVGPDLGHLVGLTDGWADSARFTDKFGLEDVYAKVVRDCGPLRVILAGPPGAVPSIAWTQDVAANGTVDRRTQPVTMRPDGFAVVTPSAPANAPFTARITGTGPRVARDQYVGPEVPPLPGDAVVRAALKAAPGNATDRSGLFALVSDSHLFLPVPQRDVRVLWAGSGGGASAAVRVSTLPSGAQYLVGGVSRPQNGAYGIFAGFIPTGALSGTAYRLQAEPGLRPGPATVAVFFEGTHQVEITTGGSTRTETATGGILVDTRSTVVVRDAGGTPLPVVDVRSLPRPESTFG